jgi:hypothetical protein
VGGRLPPYLRAGRPNPAGYFLITAGLLGLLGTMLAVAAWMAAKRPVMADTWLTFGMIGALSLLAVVSGFRLLRP